MSLCGLDFGTSNSTVGVFKGAQATMAPLEIHPSSGLTETTLPSALFFDFESDEIEFGRHAIDRYSMGDFGRLMRSMKSILGSNQMDDGTQIKHKVYSFSEIIGFFVGSLKKRGEAFCEQELSSVVMGRPVHFNDVHRHLDDAAEAKLASIAHSVGFKDVSFQYEPIAAAYDYEQTVTSEELALIIDIGGGTSDFTLIRLSDERRQLSDRSPDLLANHGVHIGGTDFDRHVSMAKVMPHLGLALTYKDKPTLKLPRHYFVDLATWHRIHNLYDPKIMQDLNELRLNVFDKEPLERLLAILKKKDGHRLAGLVEQAKIALSSSRHAELALDFIDVDDDLPAPIQLNQTDLKEAIESDVEKVFHAVNETLRQAGLAKDQIQTIFTTGGSTALPSVKQWISTSFPDAKWVSGDLFNSVGKGLVLEAARRYG